MQNQSNTLCLIFAVVDDFCKHLKRIKRKGGPKPIITRNQILKMMVLKFLLGITSDRSLVRFLNNFGKGLFKKIPDHSWFNRRSKNLLPTFEQFRKNLLEKLHVDNSLLRVIDSTPIPVVRYRRGEGPLAKSFERASFGYCATHDEKYFGFKLHLLTTGTGIPTHFDITKASLPDVKMLEELISSFNKLIVIGDKGIRKRIEITINQLKDQFNLTRLRAKSTLGLVTRIMGLMLTMTLAVFVNRLLGRPDLKIKELLM